MKITKWVAVICTSQDSWHRWAMHKAKAGAVYSQTQMTVIDEDAGICYAGVTVEREEDGINVLSALVLEYVLRLDTTDRSQRLFEKANERTRVGYFQDGFYKTSINSFEKTTDVGEFVVKYDATTDRELALRRKDDILRHLVAAKGLLDLIDHWDYFEFIDHKEPFDKLIRAVNRCHYSNFRVREGQA